jgi:hypothetical protein
MVEPEVAKNEERRSGVHQVFIVVQSIIAILSVMAAVAFILIWLLSVVLSFIPNSGLMPWVASGVSAFGLFFIFLAAIPGIPGIIWANLLVDRVRHPWDRILKGTVGTGKIAFKVGSIIAIVLLVIVIVSAMR